MNDHLSTAADPVAPPEPASAPTAQPAPAHRPSPWAALAREVLETVVLTLVIFLLIRTVVQNFRVDGASMEPNFHHGQFLLINKLAYRLGEPQRGDVIVFRYPRDPSRDFIKRVIGLPGETVEVVEGEVFINGQPLPPLPNIPQAFYSSPPVTLGPDEVFVMGDNRPNSSDSHTWGPLPLDLVIGKVVLSYWPPSAWGLVRTPPAYEPLPADGGGQP